jgi:hypothetical protein
MAGTLAILAAAVVATNFASGANAAEIWTPSTVQANAQSSASAEPLLGPITCPSPSTCLMVGSYVNDSDISEDLIEAGTLSGGVWSWTVSTPPTTGLSPASSTDYVGLSGIACSSPTSCIASGGYVDSSGDNDGILEIGVLTNGTWAWHAMTAPVSGLSPSADPTTDGHGTGLSSVSCGSATTCVAFGDYQDTNNNIDGLFEVGTLSAGTWSWAASTAPTGGLSPASTATPDVIARGISCGSGSLCVGVGFYASTTGHNNGFIETGTESQGSWSWAAITAPTTGTSPAGSASYNNTLQAASCPSATECVAVGTYADANQDIDGLFESGALTDGTWTWQSSTEPSDGTGEVTGDNGAVEPTAVSCGSTSSCAVVESPIDSAFNSAGLIEVATLASTTWSWADQSVPTAGLNPAAASNPKMQLSGMSCPSAIACVAAGSYEANGGDGYGLVETSSIPPSPPTVTGVSPNSGSESGGAAVTISGSNFTQGATVSFGGSAASEVTVYSSNTITALSPPEGAGTVDVTVTESSGTSSTSSADQFTYMAPQHGYWLVGSDGGIFTFGSALFHGSTGNLKLQRPVVGITPTADEGGYWLVASDGGIFSFGDAGFYGSIPGLGLAPAGTTAPKRLNAPIVGMVPSSDGGGYFMVASDGGVFAFGDAKFEGSCPGIGGCSGAAVAVMPDASGDGYWLVTATGHVYTFGNATYYGAPGPQLVPVTAAVKTPDGNGYWILFANGVVSNYGDAGYLGSPAGLTGGINPATAIFTTSPGGGYWVAAADGKVYDYGNAPSDGDMSGTHLNGPIIAATGF